jgi:hypothetical protein
MTWHQQQQQVVWWTPVSGDDDERDIPWTHFFFAPNGKSRRSLPQGSPILSLSFNMPTRALTNPSSGFLLRLRLLQELTVAVAIALFWICFQLIQHVTP